MKKVIIMIYLSVLISSCNGEERKENKKESKKKVQIEKVEKKSETKKEDNNSKVTYIEIKPIDENRDNEDENHAEYTEEEYENDIYYNVKLRHMSKIDKKIGDIKNGVCYMVVKGKKRICGEIKNGKREGKWKFWNSEGRKIADIGYKDGKLDGICRIEWGGEYYMSYKNGEKDGRFSFYGEESSEEEGLYEDGERIGEWPGYNGGGGFPEKKIYINGEKVEDDILSEGRNKKLRIEKYRNNRFEEIQSERTKEVYTNGEYIERIEYDENGNIEKEIR